MPRTIQNGRLRLFVPCEEPPKTVGYAFLFHVKNHPKWSATPCYAFLFHVKSPENGRFREPTKQNKTKQYTADYGGIRIFGRPAMAIWGVLHMEQKGVADHFGWFFTWKKKVVADRFGWFFAWVKKPTILGGSSHGSKSRPFWGVFRYRYV